MTTWKALSSHTLCRWSTSAAKSKTATTATITQLSHPDATDAGMFPEPIAAMIISLPVLFEVAQVINLDPIHFGMIVVLTLAIGLTTPPVGICLFIASAIADISLERISRVVLPMIGVVRRKWKRETFNFPISIRVHGKRH